jgi:hypothetical protein
MYLNKILKIVIIIAILIATGSISYHYLIFLPNQQKIKEEQTKEEKLLSYRIKFQEECDKKYDELYEKWKKDMEGFSLSAIESLDKIREESCKGKNYYFNIDNIFLCSDGKSFLHTRDTYVPACIEWKMKQINL